jgi:hypothetical protein
MFHRFLVVLSVSRVIDAFLISVKELLPLYLLDIALESCARGVLVIFNRQA